MICLQRIEGVTRLDRVRNEDICESLGQMAVVKTMKERQNRWKEKLEGMDGDKLVKQVYESNVEGRSTRGRPRKRWVDNFKYRHVWTLRNLIYYTIVISNHCTMLNVYT